MNKAIIIVIFFVTSLISFSFSQKISIEEYTLENGFKIYLNEDNSIPFVYGAIVVKGGSKYDSKDATGVAHYMEHLMFKGTEELGTTNFEAEKIFLDSISIIYDMIAETKNEAKRLEYQIQINKLSQKASDYLIVDEMEYLLEDIGSADINAYTSEDAIVYYNVFPKHQIENWLEIYSHRFEKPVFRMFQNELEVVYEEKNMTLDDPFNQFYEEYSKLMYKNHPYGQQTILGTNEHLKNPSIKKLYEYVNKFYVPNNMALILCGNFSSNEIKLIIKTLFGKWKKSEKVEIIKIKEQDLKGRELFETAITPVKYGALGFRSAPVMHKDENKITICNYLLENDMGTGLLDALYTQSKLLDLAIYQNHYIDYGDIIIEFSPNPKFKKAEKLILKAIQDLKNGNFTDEQLDAAKLYLKKEKLKNIEYVYDYFDEEEAYGRLDILSELFLSNKTWKEYLEIIESIDDINKKDVVSTSIKYFNENYIAIFSEKGQQEIPKLSKPPYAPITIRKDNKESAYANNFRNNILIENQALAVDFQKDINQRKISKNFKLYHTRCDFNNLFKLKYNIGIGKKQKPKLEYLAYYMNSCGTNDLSVNDFYLKLETLGVSIDVSCSEHFFEITLEGFNQNFAKAVELTNSLLSNPYIDKRALAKLTDVKIYEREYLQEDPNVIGEALISFAILGENSPYLKQLSGKELKSITDDDLNSLFDLINDVECNVHYSGSLPVDTVSNIISKYPQINKTKKTETPITFKRRVFEENTIYFLDMPKAIQSQIYYYVEGEINDSTEQAVSDIFSAYLDNILYNDIRDFHSLAYSTFYSFENGFRRSEKGYNIAYLSTQSDKTIDALKVLIKNITKLSFNENEIFNIKNQLLQSSNCKMTTKRNISELVEWWQLQGLKNDPIIHKVNIYRQISVIDIENFYTKNLADRKYIITIVGDKEQINMQELSKFGKIIELDKNAVFKQ